MLCTVLFTTTLSLAASSSEAALLTELISTAAAHDARFDVVTAADLRRITTLEGERQSAGCEDESACLAELASAVGARYVIFSSLGRLGAQHVMTLQLYDSATAQIKARHLERADDVSSIADRVTDVVADTLLKAIVDTGDGVARPKLLILDVATVVDAPDDSDGDGDATGSIWPTVLWSTAGVVGVLGVTGVVSSFFVDAAADDTERSLAESQGLYQARDALFVGGAIAVGVGVVAAVAAGIAGAAE